MLKKYDENELEILHKLLIDIASEVKRVCDNNNIKYFLAYGSLLGAVRHGGFIPWDDDLDIAMPRKEYERFLRIFKEEGDNIKFFLESWDTEKGYGLSFTKIKLRNTKFVENSIKNTDTNKGIFVDIFPYDELPEEKKVIRKTARKVLILGKIYKFKKGYLPTDPQSKMQEIMSKIIGKCANIIPGEYVKRKIIYEETKFNGKGKFVTVISGAYNCRDYFPLEDLDEVNDIKFEGITFTAPKRYDEVLRCIYGDYMELPPAEKRVCRHNAIEIDFGQYGGRL